MEMNALHVLWKVVAGKRCRNGTRSHQVTCQKHLSEPRKPLMHSFELNSFILIGNTCKAAEKREGEPGKFLIGIFLSGSVDRQSGQLCQDGFVSSLWGSKASRWWVFTEISCWGKKLKQECRSCRSKVVCRESIMWVHAKDMAFKEEECRKASLVSNIWKIEKVFQLI